ncbi:MAG TPA: hypothetical protein VMU19_03895 [Bryobacteraceae bacterium]|nr:hypothetical protein [Bryobacteraceae bacterium]
MPNYRAVTAGETPPPPGPTQAFRLAAKSSFDYSSFAFVAVTSGLAEWRAAHPQLGTEFAGYGRYYWRGFADKTAGNFLVLFALPAVFHQDERYYAKEEGGFGRRALYAASRVLVTPNYRGHGMFNVSEILGRAMAEGLSTSYYPSQARTLMSLGSRYGFSLLSDALDDVLLEFWPDIAALPHRLRGGERSQAHEQGRPSWRR